MSTQLVVQAAARGIPRKSLRSSAVRRSITGRRSRRSSEFMGHVYACMDCGMSFLDAVREVARDSTIIDAGRATRAELNRQERMVEHWNATVPIGTHVAFWDALTPETATTTRSKAWLVSGHASVLLDARSGSWALDFVRVVR